MAGGYNEMAVKMILYFLQLSQIQSMLCILSLHPSAMAASVLVAVSVDFRFIKSTKELRPLQTCHKLPVPVYTPVCMVSWPAYQILL